MKKGVTIILCTFNGASRLPKTIQHIAKQIIAPKIDWEVVFVDNASTDNSSLIVAQEWQKYKLNNISMTLLTEKKPGKIYALERAFASARFEYGVICDDDNWLDPKYIQTVYQILENNQKIGAVGGQGIAVTDKSVLPNWFKSHEEGYATGKQNDKSGDVTERGHLWGAGLGTRTVVYKEMYYGFPSLLTGRLGETLSAGEDAEYCQRLILAGYQLHYDSRLRFHHYLPESRLTEDYLESLYNGFVESNYVLSNYYIANELIRLSKKNPFRLAKLLSVAPWRALFSRNRGSRNKARSILMFVLPKISSRSFMSRIKTFYKEVPKSLDVKLYPYE